MSDWPYMDRHSGTESDHHVRLKNLAVVFLLEEGFSQEDIEQKVRYGRGQTDIVAGTDSREVYIECETDFRPTRGNLSAGGKKPVRDGKEVYVIADSGIHRVTEVEKEFSKTGPFGKNYYDNSQSPIKVFEYEQVIDLPDLP